MKVFTRIEYDLATGRILSFEGYNYFGPVDLLGGGKSAGRANTGAAASGAGALGTNATNLANTYEGSSLPFAKSLVPGANGGLSPYAAAQLGQEKTGIENTYKGLAQSGLKQLGNRGLAPPGSSASIINTANQNEGAAQTGAYQNAMQNTLGQGLAGINYMNPLNAIQAGTGAYGTQGQLGNLQTQQGSMLGDIGAGLSGLAGIAMPS
jgi:hypothetical protein